VLLVIYIINEYYLSGYGKVISQWQTVVGTSIKEEGSCCSCNWGWNKWCSCTSRGLCNLFFWPFICLLCLFIIHITMIIKTKMIHQMNMWLLFLS
jgi:hypothetical protein